MKNATMATKIKKIKKTWTLEPATVKIVERWAKEQKRNENAIIDRLVQEAAKKAED